jgi:hypothetical protein
MAEDPYDPDLDLRRIRASGRYLRTLAEENVGIVDPRAVVGVPGWATAATGSTNPLTKLKVAMVAQGLPQDEPGTVGSPDAQVRPKSKL